MKSYSFGQGPHDKGMYKEHPLQIGSKSVH